MNVHCLEWKGQSLILHPYKAIFWEEQNALLIADLHLGKINHFVKHGIPLPKADDGQTLTRLQDLLVEYNPASVFMLGDLFHSDWNESWDDFVDFIGVHHQVSFKLVPGNHDIMDETFYGNAGLKVCPDELFIDPFLLTHIKPIENKTHPVISGHLHPGVFLTGRGRQRLKLPCFWLGDNSMVLPAFGNFTGLSPIKVLSDQSVFVIAEDSVIAYSEGNGK